MNDNWAEVRRQMDHVLTVERMQHQARRRQQPSFWQSLRQWRSSTLLMTGRAERRKDFIGSLVRLHPRS